MSNSQPAPSGTLDFVEGVYEFNRIGQVTPPGHFNADRIGFYTGMQLEEMAEKMVSIASGIVTVNDRQAFLAFAEQVDKWGKAFKEGEMHGAVLRANREKLLDADGDIAVVTLGAMMYQTPLFRHALCAINAANLAKFPDGVAIRDPLTNKILKPAGWKAPDMSVFVDHPID